MGSDTETTRALRALLPPGVVLAVSDPREEPHGLHPAERAAVEGAAEKRLREFAAGRRAARLALRELGLVEPTVPVGAGRQPSWPPGVIGSISHTRDWCGCIVAQTSSHRSLGLDAEPDTPLEARLFRSILTRAEIAGLPADPEEAGRRAHLVFAIKEAVYKAQYPLSGSWLGFGDVEVSLEEPTACFTARMDRSPGPALPQGSLLSGRWTRAGGKLLAVLALRAC